MAQKQADFGEELSEVNVIPLADLSLVLLIILMVISPMIMQSTIKVTATRASRVKSLQPNPPEPPLIILINPDAVLLNSKQLGDADLAAELARALNQRNDKTVLVTADPAALHGRVVQILDLVKQNGADKIALLRKAVPSAPAATPKQGKKA